MVKGVSPHVTVERRHLVYKGIARNFILCEKKACKDLRDKTMDDKMA